MQFWEEWRVSRIVVALVAVTESSLPADRCRELVVEGQPPWQRRPVERDELLRTLGRRCSRPERFKELVAELHASGTAVLDPYLELLHWAKLGPPPMRPLDSDLPELCEELYRAAATRKGCWSLVPAGSRRPPSGSDFGPLIFTAPEGPTFATQESQLIDDLLSCLLGFHGVYVTANEPATRYDRRTFTISAAVDPKLRGLAGRILMLASCRSTIVRFVEESRSQRAGAVNQTLGLALDGVVLELTSRVAALEAFHRRRRLELGLLWAELCPSCDVFGTLASLASLLLASCTRGGATLSLLDDAAHGLLLAQDPVLCTRLLHSSCVPYFRYISAWIFEATLNDPYDEFMVVRDANLDVRSPTYSEDYWRRGFSLNDDRVPKFLKDFSQHILYAGWYLDLIRKSRPPSDAGPYLSRRPYPILVYDPTEEGHIRIIEEAYTRANDALMEMMTQNFEITGRIRRAKNYFLLERGDLFLSIVEHCEKELERPVTDICPVYLESLLRSALESTGTGLAEDIGFELKKESLLTQLTVIEHAGVARPQKTEILTGLEAFTLTVTPSWPVSLVFNRGAIICCQLLFRALFYSKYVEYSLIRVKGLWKKSLDAHALRHQMVCFVQAVHYYMTEDTIQVHWAKYIHKLENTKSLDDMISSFSNFLQSSLSGCMLMDLPLAASYWRLLGVCFDYSKHLSIKLDPDVGRYRTLFTQLAATFLDTARRKDSWKTCADLIFLRANFNNYYPIKNASRPAEDSSGVQCE